MRIDLYSSKGVSLTLFGELQTPNDLASAWRDAGFTYKEGQHITALRSVDVAIGVPVALTASHWISRLINVAMEQ